MFLGGFLVPVMLASVGPRDRVLERLWPVSQSDELSRPRFIRDRASVDVHSSALLAGLEKRRAFANLSRYFEAVRRRGTVLPLREASRRPAPTSVPSNLLLKTQPAEKAAGKEDRHKTGHVWTPPRMQARSLDTTGSVTGHCHVWTPLDRNAPLADVMETPCGCCGDCLDFICEKMILQIARLHDPALPSRNQGPSIDFFLSQDF